MASRRWLRSASRLTGTAPRERPGAGHGRNGERPGSLLAEGLRFTVASARSCASLRHLLAFGDGANDIGLLQAAAVALAVANAVPDLKRHASAVIAANDDDAVARYASVHWRARRR